MELTMNDVKEEIRSAIADSFRPEEISEAVGQMIKESTKPGVAKGLEEIHGEEKVDVAKTFCKFFKTIYDHEVLHKPLDFSPLGKAIADEILQTGVDAQGGYTVPTVIFPWIEQEEFAKSLVRQKCNFFPQTVMTQTLPILDTSISVTYPDETASGLDTEPVLGSVTFSMKRAVAIIPVTNDLLRSSAVNMGTWLAQLIGGQFGENLDLVCFQDATSPYTGILNGAGNSVTMAAGETIDDLEYGDLVDMISSTKFGVGDFVMSQTVFGVVNKLVDANGRPIFVGPGLGVPGTLLNHNYYINTQMPTATAGAEADTAVMFFGDLKNYWVGESGGLEIAMSKDASMALGAGTVSAFQNDLTLIRGTRRVSANLALADTFCKLETGSA